ncbi:cytochrome c biogenesis CcdA family protein [Leucobacter tenebrionis]|uniref:cytochrome c biogenesis CcdA family protein n=1 Tax=Leucobacter tenebrionis TaxID=2873270 RepID=UPI001CA73D48|nr:cytochrome c biogenesis protein CcdA [Leucobacter tenebrionis]QZY50570.1 cytochrome c biogenesis protein CcdA [Leucobacter tenebrionis]
MGLQDIVADGQLLVASLIAVAAGLLSFLSPCVLPLIPGYLAYVSGVAGTGTGSAAGADPARARRSERRRMVIGALLFVLGFTAVFLALFVLLGAVGMWIWEWEEIITRVAGVVVILMGLVFMGAFSRLQRTSRMKLKPRVGLVGAPLLGIVFAVGWAPCMGPTLGTIGLLAAQQGSIARAAILAVAYCLGLGLPFILAAFGFGWMTQTMTFFKRHIRAVNLIGGALLILIGLLLVTGLWSRMMFALQAVIGGYVTPL